MTRLPAFLMLILAVTACTPLATVQVDRDLSRTIDSGQLTGGALAEAYVDRGTVRLLNDDVDAAIADYDAAATAAPDHVAAYVWRGQAWDAKGDRRRAREDFDHAIALDPQAWHAYGARGLMLARTDEPDGALSDLGRAIELGKDHEKDSLVQHTSMTPMQIQNSKGAPDFVTAKAEFTLRADYYLSYIRAVRGGLLLDRGRYDEALIDLDEAARLNPQSPRAHWNLGLAQLAIGRCAEGVRELRAASALTFGATPAYMSSERNRAFVAKTACRDVVK
jgi:tetratricopeptide (TPR) repeat protein